MQVIEINKMFHRARIKDGSSRDTIMVIETDERKFICFQDLAQPNSKTVRVFHAAELTFITK